jgi:hypothetical protein
MTSNHSGARLQIYDGVSTIDVASHTGGGSEELITGTVTIAAGATQLRCYVLIASSAGNNVSITSGDYIEFTELQLELGSVATDFEHRSYGEELALCQRYYHRLTPGSSMPISTGGTVNSTTIALMPAYPHPVDMRVVPTITKPSAGNFQIRHRNVATVCTVVVATASDNRVAFFTVTVASGLTVGDGCYLRSGGAGTYVGFDAEL